MKNILCKMKSFTWVIALFAVCLTFSFNFAGAESDDHNHEHESHQEDSNHDDESGTSKEHEEHGDHDEQEEEHDEHGDHEEGSRKVGEGKAVLELDKQKGFKLSPEAYQALGVKHQRVENGQFHIPKSALVRMKNTTGIYRYKDQFFSLISVGVLNEDKNQYHLKTPLKAGDHVVVQGVELLRVADIYSQDTSE